jgi:hypothetical protein
MKWPERYPLLFMAAFAVMLVGAFSLGRMGGNEKLAQYEIAAESSRLVTLDEPENPSSKFDERILLLDRLAIEEAYKNQVLHLFEVWLKDETGQPRRAINGVRKARRAFVGAMEAIEKREKVPAQ